MVQEFRINSPLSPNSLNGKITNKRNGRVAIIEQLLADGIRYMFGNPGTVEEGFLDSLSDYYPEFEYILALQETIAVATAEVWGADSSESNLLALEACASSNDDR